MFRRDFNLHIIFAIPLIDACYYVRRRTLRRRTLRRRTLRRNFTYLRLCGPLVLIDNMIYNNTKSCKKHNQLALWSLLRLDTKILKEARGDPPEEARHQRQEDSNCFIVLFKLFCYIIFMIFMYAYGLLYTCFIYKNRNI